MEGGLRSIGMVNGRYLENDVFCVNQGGQNKSKCIVLSRLFDRAAVIWSDLSRRE
jgi:hypothetical protein